MAIRKRFNPIDYYGGARAASKSLSVAAPRRKYAEAPKVPLGLVGNLFKNAAGPIADAINAYREEKDTKTMQEVLGEYRRKQGEFPDPNDLSGVSSRIDDFASGNDGGFDDDDEPLVDVNNPQAVAEYKKFYADELAGEESRYSDNYDAGRLGRAKGLIEPGGRLEGEGGPRTRDMISALQGREFDLNAANKVRDEQRAYNATVAKALADSKIAAARAKRGNVKYGNTPIWGTGKDGRPIVMQPSSAGGPLRVAELPEGVTAQRGGTRTVDLGDRYAVLDANGGLIGYRVKGIDPEKTPEYTGSVAAAKAGGTGMAARRLTDYSLARNATNNIKDIDTLTSRLLSTDEGVVGFLVDLRVFRDQALAKFGSQEALGRVTDTQMVNTLTGKEVFPLIKALGIGARGLDTPAERKFLREVLTGDKTLTKDTLLEMAAMRRKVQVRNIERWNKDFKDGSLNDFLRTNNIPNRAFTMPPPAPVRTPVDISGPISTMNGIQLKEKARGATADEKRQIDLRLKALGF